MGKQKEINRMIHRLDSTLSNTCPGLTTLLALCQNCTVTSWGNVINAQIKRQKNRILLSSIIANLRGIKGKYSFCSNQETAGILSYMKRHIINMKVYIHSFAWFPKCLAGSLLITSLPLSHTVKLNAEIIAANQSSIAPPSALLFFHSPCRCLCATYLLLISASRKSLHPSLQLMFITTTSV